MDKWIKCIAKGGNIQATAITAKDLIETAQLKHSLGENEIKPLGEAMLAGLLLASTCKHGERINLSVKGDHYLKQVIVDAYPTGIVRGFIDTRKQHPPLDNSKGPWQNGLLYVMRVKPEQKDPYIGVVPNVTGHLAKDITYYLSQSEQIPSAVGLVVNTDTNGTAQSAGAFLVQIMPGATLDEIKMVENNIQSMEKLAKQIAVNENPTSILGQVFNDMIFTLLEERPLRFECSCSRERVKEALHLFGIDELKDMIAKDGGTKIHCDFCSDEFKFNTTELEEIIREYKK